MHPDSRKRPKEEKRHQRYPIQRQAISEYELNVKQGESSYEPITAYHDKTMSQGNRRENSKQQRQESTFPLCEQE